MFDSVDYDSTLFSLLFDWTYSTRLYLQYLQLPLQKD